jgi:Carboxypeptidase regulatory-like domain/TonB-dependent Receptor Plug Domain
MRSWMKTYCFIFGLMLVMSLPSLSQNSATRGGLGGVVYDSSGAVVPGITVNIVGPQGTYTVKTDAAGRYEVSGVIPGSYKITIEAPGFKKYVSDHNQVQVDHTANLDAHLALGAATDTVQVDAGAVQIDTSTVSLNAPISDELYESLPVARNVAAIFSLAPGVVSGGGTDTQHNGSNPSIGGATGLENLYLVDGVTITDQAFGGLGTYNRNFGSLGSGVNLAFIKEVDVKTGAFEPKYGRADGGIVEIVTKSGSTKYHGALAAYLGPGSWYADRFQLSSFNYVNTIYANYLSNPQYDVAAEMGGPVPGFKNKMFFFGAFDPTLVQDIAEAPVGAPLHSHGPYAYSATTLSWAAKLTYQPFNNTQLEMSTFGDPAHHNQIPGPTYNAGLSALNAESVGTRYNYGSRDSVARLSTAISPTWTAIGVYTFNFNHFDQAFKHDNYQISNRTTTPFIVSYVGSYEPTKNNDYSINGETEKKFHFLGEHTLSLGYQYDHTNFLDKPSRTGPLAAIPGTNAAGVDITPLMGIHATAVGQKTNAAFRLFNADPSCTYCTMLNGVPVYLQQIRGTYKGLSVNATSRYHVGWVNDSYQMNRHFTINGGLRWEEQWYAGTLLKYLFNDNWSPRAGFNYDPFGDQRSKVFFNYARYQLVLPLDAAIRQLGNEQDDSFFFTPQADSSGNAVLDALGAVVPVIDGAHTLNGLPGKSATASFGNPTFASSTGEGILPTTKMEYENEYVLGIEREIVPGSVLQVRYSDRRLGRIIEDIGSESVEGSVMPEGFVGGIANVSAGTDISVNENEVTYTPAQWAAANPNAATPGAATAPGTNPLTDYVAPVAGCTFSNDTSVAYGDFWRHFDGTPYNAACITNLDVAAGGGPDGKPDGFAKPIRRYQELVVEYNRNLKNHWEARANYRFAKLYGNYEGLFRNDNGQSDPGISSLFDFTAGALGLLGDQFKPGYLNTDRRNVANVSVAYVVGKDSSFLSVLNKMTLGTNLRGAAGNPLSAYQSHPAPSYANPGEVPVGGRGTKGNLPYTLQFDGHMDYPVQLKEKYTLKLAFDAFNILNAQHMTNKNQNLDSAPGTISPDYGKPLGFQQPFYARASIRLEF